MSRKIGSFGILMLVVVMGAVLFLVAQAWKKMAPAAIDVSGGARSETPGIEVQLEPGGLPRLDDVRETTDSHADDVQEALATLE